MSTLLWIVIALVVVALIVGMIIWEEGRFFLACILMFAIIGTGVASGFQFYEYYTTQSQVIGALEEHNPYEDFDFYEYDLDAFSLLKNEETGVYYYSEEYATSQEFNGTANKYILLINDKPCDITMSDYGKLRGTTTIHFDDVDGNEIHTIEVEVLFIFYANSICISVDTTATDDNAGMLQEYFKINGFNLRIIEEISYSSPILTDSAVD